MKGTVTIPKWSYYLMLGVVILNVFYHANNIIHGPQKINIHIIDGKE